MNGKGYILYKNNETGRYYLAIDSEQNYEQFVIKGMIIVHPFNNGDFGHHEHDKPELINKSKMTKIGSINK